MAKDDLTIGPIVLHYKNLAIPAALGMLFMTLYNVVDVYYAGQLSTQAQAGLAIGFQAFFILMAVGFGLGSMLVELETEGADVAAYAASISEVLKLRGDVETVSLGALPRDGVVIADLREAR